MMMLMSEQESWKLLRDMIANEENAFGMGEIKFGDMGDLEVPEDSFKGKCGTPSCIVGWNNYLSVSIHGYKKLNIPYDIALLSVGEVNWASNPERFTRKKTVAVLDHYIETGEVN